MDLKVAEALKNSPNLEERRRARLALLGAHAEVKAAHSRTDAEAVREKKEAFEMFRGASAQEGPWTPHKRVLANVDIFSEGVSIPEIDTVVLSDDDKLNERSMTQAIGRSIRTVSGNAYKTTGHVVIPSVKDSTGVSLTGASEDLAAYGITRVERGVTPLKLRGVRVRPDTTSSLKVYSEEGTLREVTSPRGKAQEAVSSLKPLLAAAAAEGAHSTLLAQKDSTYGALSKRERGEAVKSYLRERTPRNEEEALRATEVNEYLKAMSPQEVDTLRRKGRVVSSALASGDVGALSPKLAKTLITGGVLQTEEEIAEVTFEEKKALVERYAQELSVAALTRPGNEGRLMTPAHQRAHAALGLDIRKEGSLMGDSLKLVRGSGKETAGTKKLAALFSEKLSDRAFVEDIFEMAHAPEANLPIKNQALKRLLDLEEDQRAMEAAKRERIAAEAASGEQRYSVAEGAVRRDGALTARTLKSLFKVEAWGEV